MSTIVSWIEKADSAALAVVDDDAEITYGNLRAEAEDLARVISETYGRGRFLVIPAERSIHFIRALVAASMSGNVPVPVDPLAPEAAIRQIGQRCGDWALMDPAMPVPNRGEPPTSVAMDRDLPELVIFTSGTSGVPKGVPVSSGNLRHSARVVSEYLDYAGNPSAAVVLPLHYSYALLSQVLFMFFVGGRVRLFSSLRNPIEFSRRVDREDLRTFCGVPSTFSALCTMHRMAPLSMPRVRVVCSAGAALDRAMLPNIKEIFSGAAFFDNYGMTEATPRISYLREDDPRFLTGTCGRPIDGLEVVAVDESDFRHLDDGEQGIIAVRGPNVFEGYLNDPESTQQAFTPDGFVLSGDIGYVRDGYIYLQGRKDEIFNVGGEKVSPLEIERALSEHPQVLRCAVGSVRDVHRGDMPVAYVELSGPVEKPALVQFMNTLLPSVKVPVRYFAVRSFPLTGSGKLQRSRLSPESTEFVISEID